MVSPPCLMASYCLRKKEQTPGPACLPACQPCRSGPCLTLQPQVLASPSLRALSRSLLSDPEAPALGSLRLVLSSEPFKKSASVPPERFKLSGQGAVARYWNVFSPVIQSWAQMFPFQPLDSCINPRILFHLHGFPFLIHKMV